MMRDKQHVAGIEKLAWSTGNLYFDLKTLAKMRQEEEEKYTKGIGQQQMSLCSPTEDIVTMGAEAANTLLKSTKDPNLKQSIRMVLFATESSVDQSKAAGLWVHRLLNLPSSCRVMELKQACFSTTAALQLAACYVRNHPTERVLVIGSDEAIYTLNTPAEPTQGAGAVAMLISCNPKIATIEPISGIHCEEVSDFWRPNSKVTPFVDGKLSTRCYLHSLKQCLIDYQQRGGLSLEHLSAFCFHTPFVKMAHKALEQVIKKMAHPSLDTIRHNLAQSLIYCETIGNCYSASLWIALSSMLENAKLQAGDHIGLFSYGSGAVGEFFTLTLSPNFKDHLVPAIHQNNIQNRTLISEGQYLNLHQYKTRLENRPCNEIDSSQMIENVYGQQQKPFVYNGNSEGKRIYTKSGQT